MTVSELFTNISNSIESAGDAIWNAELSTVFYVVVLGIGFITLTAIADESSSKGDIV